MTPLTNLVAFIITATVVNCKYNILWLQSDEMDGRVLDPRTDYWNIVSMPNLRQLASEGINFVNNYCNSPLCAPSRTSMWTGRYINGILAWSNVKSLTAQVTDPSKPDKYCAAIVGYGEEWCVNMGRKQNVTTTIKQSMEAAGYDVNIFGKMDIGGGMGTGYHSHDDGNWSTNVEEGGSCSNKTTNNYCPGDIIRSWTRQTNVTSGVYLPPFEGDWINIHSVVGGSMGVIDEPVTVACEDYLHAYANRDIIDRKPFLLYCSMVNPHPPYWTNRTWTKYLNYSALNKTFNKVVSVFNGTFNDMHPADKYKSMAESIGNIDLYSEWAFHLWEAYFATCAELDNRMGRIINKLRSYPYLYENTLILYTSDHGELHLEHLQVEKQSLYEGSARVPLIIKGPNIAAHQLVNNVTSLVDIFPTFLHTANISYENPMYPKNLNGYSLSTFFNWSWISNQPYVKERPDYVFSEYHGESSNDGSYMLRQNEYKLILYATNSPFENYKPQLFNVVNDKNEMNNIADDNTEIVKNMTNIINSILMETSGGDYNFVDNQCQSEGKQNFIRWKTEISGDNTNLWIDYVNSTLTSFDQNDLQKIMNWIEQNGTLNFSEKIFGGGI